jgi:hypothetical protein
MNDGGWVGYGVRLSTSNFSYEEQKIILLVLKEKFNLNCTIQKSKNYYCIYIKKDSLKELKRLTSIYMISSMKYKLGGE